MHSRLVGLGHGLGEWNTVKGVHDLVGWTF